MSSIKAKAIAILSKATKVVKSLKDKAKGLILGLVVKFYSLKDKK